MTNEEMRAYKGNPAGTIFGLMEHIRPKKCKMVNGGNRMTPQEALNHFEEHVCKHCCEWDKSLRHCNNCPTDTAKKALKKQIPKKPVKLNCPRCGFDKIDNSWWVFTYCPQCGQLLDWEVTE